LFSLFPENIPNYHFISLHDGSSFQESRVFLSGN